MHESDAALRPHRAMITLFSAVLSEVGETVAGRRARDGRAGDGAASAASTNDGRASDRRAAGDDERVVAWSVAAGRGRHALMRRGSVVGDAPLAVVDFARRGRRITDGSGTTQIASAQGNRLDVAGPTLERGEYAIRRHRVMRGLLESSSNFVARHRDNDVLVAHETTHRGRTQRAFDVRMHARLDPNVGLSMLLLFGGVDRQGVLGELFENS